ncbi:MAG: lipocalin family protein [Proteobacteria bacterium]|nr:lipocalin family protein [Pseudomonadota bacterium]
MTVRKSLLTTASSIFLSTCASSPKYEKTVEYVDMDRFMTKWYVIASRPTFMETGAFNAVETYTFDKTNKQIMIGFQFNENSLDGAVKNIPQFGWIFNEATNAHWKVKPTWWWFPFKFDYLVIGLEPNYEWTAIGVPDQKYLWIMANKPNMSEEKLTEIKQSLEVNGYDVTKLNRIAHGQPSGNGL